MQTVESSNAAAATVSLNALRVYGTAAVFLVIGLAVGYFFRQTQPALTASGTSAAATSAGSIKSPHAHHMPTLDEMKHMADKQAAPLMEKLKSDPKNASLLMQVGGIYHATHQFKEASQFYAKAAEADPKNTVAHTKLASSLFRSGDTDGAIVQLNEALSIDPKDPNALFNLGMIRLQGKRDSKGALVAWKRLLKSNPDLALDRKAEVQKLIAQVASMQSDQRGGKGGIVE